MPTDAWKKEPAIETGHSACMNRGSRSVTFGPDNVIAVGFGYAALHKDGVPVWSEYDAIDDNTLMTGADAEALAAQDPDHDWRIVLHGPLSHRVYQRHAASDWFLIEKGEGFA